MLMGIIITIIMIIGRRIKNSQANVWYNVQLKFKVECNVV